MKVFLGPIAGGIAVALAALIAQRLGITLTEAQTGQLGEAITLGMVYLVGAVSSMTTKKWTNPMNVAVLPVEQAAGAAIEQGEMQHPAEADGRGIVNRPELP